MTANAGLATGPNNVFALEIMHDAIVAIFAADKRPCEFAFGWREINRQGQWPIANICTVPGDPQGALGELTGARFPGQVPVRPLAGIQELFTVNLQASDPGAPEDERAQYRATRRLYDDWMRALILTNTSNWFIKSQSWMTAKTERRFGTGIKVVGGILAVIPDSVVTLAPVGTRALITESLNSTSDGVVEMLSE